jgi:hypothetical protein
MSRSIIAVAAGAIAVSLVAAAITPTWAQSTVDPDLYFDLGIDTSLLPQDAVGAKAYLAKQSPETQQVLKAACDRYVKHPGDAEMPQTVKFCGFILAK